MVSRLSAAVRRLRRRLSRSERFIRSLGLSVPADDSKPGLILIQIDGLSRKELERALRRGRMPFLQTLVSRDRYRLHTLYSGLPSTTPAIQGELFYGVPQVVPAFAFRDHAGNSVVRMIEWDVAARVEARLRDQGGPPLLSGGSCYSNIFTGGATEAHFCPAAMGSDAQPWTSSRKTKFRLLLWHFPSILRMLGLAATELGLAITDMVRGVGAGHGLLQELKFIPKRVAVAVMLRELVTIGASIDAARGLPVIHLNLLGYDEQAHRRGPASGFAHWSLRGIDHAIRRVWTAAQRSSRREYEVWVYSDHGQQGATPYELLHQRSVEAAIEAVLKEELGLAPKHAEDSGLSEKAGLTATAKPAETVAVGPLGFIYLETALSRSDEERVAQALVRDAHIPLVLVRGPSGHATAWCKGGRFTLPEDAASVLGPEHPFLSSIASDLVALCHHADAGAFVISGQQLNETPVTFPSERGAHGGPGIDESRAFALLPPQAPFTPPEKGDPRPLDLRNAALTFLGKVAKETSRRRHANPSTGLRLVTYNVHSCLGVDGRLSPRRIARVLAHCDADVIALQEVDVGRRRTGLVDQAHEIAAHLQMEYQFYPAIAVEEEQYGDAILSRVPLRLVHAAKLPQSQSDPHAEPRGAIWVEVELNGQCVQVINTHLGLGARERFAQVTALLGGEWLGHAACKEPLVLCGDFNVHRRSAAYRLFDGRLTDAQAALNKHRRRPTWFSDFPLLELDRVFFSGPLRVNAIEVPRNALTVVASDHLPLIVEFLVAEHDASEVKSRRQGSSV
jgi:endonuclease/exonuclease/phosphatase family metal-dependent hydrolase